LGLACLFAAWGFTRIAIASGIVMVPAVIAFAVLEAQGHKIDWAVFSVTICCMIVGWALLAIFPLTFVAFLIASLAKTPLYFAVALTRLRRSPANERGKIKLDIKRSVNHVGFASAASCVLWGLISAFKVAVYFELGELFIAIAFSVVTVLLPVVWLYLFKFVVLPKGG
jgi:hypothetical protein